MMQAGSQPSVLVKTVLVLLVFPALAWLITLGVALPLSLAAFALPQAWHAAWAQGVLWMSSLVGVAGGFLVCRRYWVRHASPGPAAPASPATAER